MLLRILLLGSLLALAGCTRNSSSPSSLDWEVPTLPFYPRTYLIQRAPESPKIDGQLAESSWREAEWTTAE